MHPYANTVATSVCLTCLSEDEDSDHGQPWWTVAKSLEQTKASLLGVGSLGTGPFGRGDCGLRTE